MALFHRPRLRASHIVCPRLQGSLLTADLLIRSQQVSSQQAADHVLTPDQQSARTFIDMLTEIRQQSAVSRFIPADKNPSAVSSQQVKSAVSSQQISPQPHCQ